MSAPTIGAHSAVCCSRDARRSGDLRSSRVPATMQQGRFFLMDPAGPDTTSPIASSTSELLDWFWRSRILPKGVMRVFFSRRRRQLNVRTKYGAQVPQITRVEGGHGIRDRLGSRGDHRRSRRSPSLSGQRGFQRCAIGPSVPRATNPFTRQPLMIKPHPGAAHVWDAGTRIGLMHWSLVAA
jgi:hypothetical protein